MLGNKVIKGYIPEVFRLHAGVRDKLFIIGIFQLAIPYIRDAISFQLSSVILNYFVTILTIQSWHGKKTLFLDSKVVTL